MKKYCIVHLYLPKCGSAYIYLISHDSTWYFVSLKNSCNYRKCSVTSPVIEAGTGYLILEEKNCNTSLWQQKCQKVWKNFNTQRTTTSPDEFQNPDKKQAMVKRPFPDPVKSHCSSLIVHSLSAPQSSPWRPCGSWLHPELIHLTDHCAWTLCC